VLTLHRQPGLVAIKVARSDARQATEELRLYRQLAQTESNRNHVVLPLDEFQQAGPNGKHQCLVFEPMGPSVGLLLEGISDSLENITSFNGPPPPLPPPPPPPSSAAEAPSTTQLTLGRRKALLKQLLLGLNCLHSGAVAHGDLNPGNFLLVIRQFSGQDVQNIRTSCENSGKSAPVRRIDGEQDLWAPRYLYLDRPLVDFVDMEHKVSAKLSDLGAGKHVYL
jgi:serine/threonine protein kinase